MAASPEVGQAGDEGLVRAARSGDMHAFQELYARYSRMVHGVLLSRMPYGDVEDMVQEVFLTAMRKLRDLRDPSAFGGWLAVIARNCANDYHRNAAPTESLESHELPPDKTAQTDDLTATAVMQVLRHLPEAYRETLVLRLVEGLTGPEIAERTGLTHGSVRVNLSRGMQMLRQALEKRGTP